jgi:hypothetical protein
MIVVTGARRANLLRGRISRRAFIGSGRLLIGGLFEVQAFGVRRTCPRRIGKHWATYQE